MFGIHQEPLLPISKISKYDKIEKYVINITWKWFFQNFLNINYWKQSAITIIIIIRRRIKRNYCWSWYEIIGL